jgi:hypothetical protein
MPAAGDAVDTPIVRRAYPLLRPRNGNTPADPHIRCPEPLQCTTEKGENGLRKGYQKATHRHVTPCNCPETGFLSFFSPLHRRYIDAP